MRFPHFPGVVCPSPHLWPGKSFYSCSCCSSSSRPPGLPPAGFFSAMGRGDYEFMDEIARRNYREMLRAVASVGLSAVAEAAGVDESTVSRWKAKAENGKPGQWETFCKVLEALDLKIVPADYKAIDPAEAEALLVLAKTRLNRIKSADELMFSHRDE
jgi:DNA-binding phage protein